MDRDVDSRGRSVKDESEGGLEAGEDSLGFSLVKGHHSAKLLKINITITICI